MTYKLESLANDCRAALQADDGPEGRIKVRDCIARACADQEFVSTHLGPQVTAEREIIYEDPDLGFCILAHVYEGPKSSSPHDHGPSWAIYGQAAGETQMTDWKVLRVADKDEPGLVEEGRTYKLTPGDAYLYNIGDVHSPARAGTTRLIRVEGMDMKKVSRFPYKVAA
jgi:hypothetical protein